MSKEEKSNGCQTNGNKVSKGKKRKTRKATKVNIFWQYNRFNIEIKEDVELERNRVASLQNCAWHESRNAIRASDMAEHNPSNIRRDKKTKDRTNVLKIKRQHQGDLQGNWAIKQKWKSKQMNKRLPVLDACEGGLTPAQCSSR